MTEFQKALYAALWFETGGLFDPNIPGCIDGTDHRRCGTSGGPDDHGGLTKYGIAKSSHPEVDIYNLTLEQASAIYYNDYWVKCSCDKIPAPLGAYVFDFACGSGTDRSIQKLQKALGVQQDGIIGPATLSAITTQGVNYVLGKMTELRLKFYTDIGNYDPSQVKFESGWNRRAQTFVSVYNRYV